MKNKRKGGSKPQQEGEHEGGSEIEIGPHLARFVEKLHWLSLLRLRIQKPSNARWDYTTIL